jgi:hypothetical protein
LIDAFFPKKTNIVENIKKRFILQNSSKIKSFLIGDYLRNKSITEYSEIVNYIKSYPNINDFHFDKIKEIDLERLIWVYQLLIDYKRLIRRIMTFNSGWLEVSSRLLIFSIDLTNNISENLAGKYDELDKSLELLINPLNLSFTEENLIANFKYPKDNLKDIEMELY